MRSHFAAFAIAAVSLFTVPTAAVGQQSQAGPILNELELRQALSGTGAIEHAKLEAHFVALADRYASDAKRHETMARNAPAGSHKGIGPDVRAHCNNLVRLDKKMEAEARDLAKLHAAAAPGQPHPEHTKGLPSDLGARKASEDEMTAFAEKAAATGDHGALAEYFSKLAERYDAEASAHAGMATMYRTGRTAGAADHCDRLVRTARAAAKEAKAAAAQHAALKSGR
jgi:hypothetical protein